jgi:[CysO sulfur-carrier protein]-S-L-cysteine hydrolase
LPAHRFGLDGIKEMITLRRAQIEEMYAHARSTAPEECCGLVGGTIETGHARTVYRLRNTAADPLVAYEAAPQELFAAQRSMRGRNEQLLAIYHSHPRSSDPVPSESDVRLAYYPAAIYFIIGLGEEGARLRAFRLREREGRWERTEYAVTE